MKPGRFGWGNLFLISEKENKLKRVKREKEWAPAEIFLHGTGNCRQLIVGSKAQKST